MTQNGDGPAYPEMLRDQLAAQAMQGLVASGDWHGWFESYAYKDGPEDPTEAACEAVSRTAYGIADAMLAARKRAPFPCDKERRTSEECDKLVEMIRKS